jgi:hypothetical protein
MARETVQPVRDEIQEKHNEQATDESPLRTLRFAACPRGFMLMDYVPSS